MRKISVNFAVKNKGYRIFRIIDGQGRELRTVAARKDEHGFPMFYDIAGKSSIENKDCIGGPFTSVLDIGEVLDFFRFIDMRTAEAVEITDEYRKKEGKKCGR